MAQAGEVEARLSDGTSPTEVVAKRLNGVASTARYGCATPSDSQRVPAGIVQLAVGPQCFWVWPLRNDARVMQPRIEGLLG